MYIFLSVFCFLIFLFTLYTLSKDDVYFIKKSVSLEDMYNIAFLCLIVGLFTARFGHVVIYFQNLYLNPLAFLAVPYYPGLSLMVGSMGSFVWARMYLVSQHLPVERITDFLSVSALSALSVGFAFNAVIQTIIVRKILPGDIFQGASYMVFFLVISFFFLPLSRSGRLKDGSMTGIFFIGISFIYFIYDSFFVFKDDLFFLGKEGIIAVFLLIFSIVFILWQEKAFYHVRRFFKRRTM